jgi:hypothetical protein
MKIRVQKIRTGSDLGQETAELIRNSLMDIGRRTYRSLDDAVGEVRQMLGENSVELIDSEYDPDPRDGSVTFGLKRQVSLNNKLFLSWHRLPQHYEVVLTLT